MNFFGCEPGRKNRIGRIIRMYAPMTNNGHVLPRLGPQASANRDLVNLAADEVPVTARQGFGVELEH